MHPFRAVPQACDHLVDDVGVDSPHQLGETSLNGAGGSGRASGVCERLGDPCRRSTRTWLEQDLLHGNAQLRRLDATETHANAGAGAYYLCCDDWLVVTDWREHQRK